MMTINEFHFPSENGRDRLYAWIAAPEGAPAGLVQIVHGLGCHSGRYRYMAERLCEAGFAVCADDHAGHGRTAMAAGTFGDPGGKGFTTFVKDEHSLHEIAASRFPDAPFLLFGHSMGSMIGRAYAAMVPEDKLRGLALCGICQQHPGAEALMRDPELAELIAQGRGPDKTLGEAYSSRMGADANRRFPGEGPLAWLSKDPGVRDDYCRDACNNHSGQTLQMVFDFVELYRYTTCRENAAAIPAGLPILLLSGDQDPCGNYGEGLYHAANDMAESGHRVRTLAYTGYRHEIHNNPETRGSVIDALIGFFRECVHREAL